MKDDKLIAAFEAWEELSQTPDTVIAYQSRLKAIIDDSARHYGREEGKEEMVKNLLSMGMTIEIVETASGLTEAQINKIKQQKESL